jgi:ribosomal protein S18 acetylase RimI-like enzyme
VQDIKIRLARFDEPAVVALLIDVLAELADRYGGSGDDTPVAPDDFAAPNGAFFVAVETETAEDSPLPAESPAGRTASPASLGMSPSSPGVSSSSPGASPSSLSASHSSVGATEEAGGERLIGCAGWRRHGADAELKRMYTAKAARGRGLGRRLLVTIEDSAREAGCKRLILETGDRQPEAVALYESAGYARIEDFGYYADHEGVLSFAKLL